MTSLYSPDIVMILLWFYFSGLMKRVMINKYLVTGDWSQSRLICTGKMLTTDDMLALKPQLQCNPVISITVTSHVIVHPSKFKVNK